MKHSGSDDFILKQPQFNYLNVVEHLVFDFFAL